ncbi:MAG TPA: dTDP-4-dehydrorhamnose reductase [Actinomycetota bacterium]|jgi:dTDP-4-dehydrorhamnose reductase|nr:dTDP-4-dehydrorhamnose reductase [Actinomycetota bacterium]
MRIVVTGAGGGVGRALMERAADHEIVGLGHDELPVEERGQVLDRIRRSRPDVVVHLGAMTGVDACEDDPDRAFAVNAQGTANVADAARETAALMVYTSTDYVFDGEKEEPYVESDSPNPLSAYGRSKLAGEDEVRLRAPEHLVVRTGWLFGVGKDFFSRSLARLAAGESVEAIVDRNGTPTYVPHLAGGLVALLTSGLRGLVHLAGPEPTTWFDLLARARDLAGLPGEPTEQKSDDLGLPARRPRNSALASEILPVPGVDPLPPLDGALREMVERAR